MFYTEIMSLVQKLVHDMSAVEKVRIDYHNISFWA